MQWMNRQVLEVQMILQQLSNVRMSRIALWVIPNERIVGTLAEDARKALRVLVPPNWLKFEQERAQQRDWSADQLGVLRAKHEVTDELLKEVDQHWQTILAATVEVIGLKPLLTSIFYEALEAQATTISAQEIRFFLALGLLIEKDLHAEEVVTEH